MSTTTKLLCPLWGLVLSPEENGIASFPSGCSLFVVFVVFFALCCPMLPYGQSFLYPLRFCPFGATIAHRAKAKRIKQQKQQTANNTQHSFRCLFPLWGNQQQLRCCFALCCTPPVRFTVPPLGGKGWGNKGLYVAPLGQNRRGCSSFGSLCRTPSGG